MQTEDQQSQSDTDETVVADDTKSTVETVIDDAKSDTSLAGDDDATETPEFGEAYLKDGAPDLEKIAAALERVHTDIPAEDGEYDLSFGEGWDLKDVDGNPVAVDPKDPIVNDFTGIARKHGIGQAALSDLMGVYGNIIKGAHEANTAHVEKQKETEFKLLGEDVEKGQQRAVSAAKALRNAVDTDEKRQAIQPLIDGLDSAAKVMGLEVLLDAMGVDYAASPKADGAAPKKSIAERLYG